MNNRPPYTYKDINIYDSRHRPTALHTHDTVAFHKYQNQLFNIAMARFDFTLPDTWDRSFFLELLYSGFAAIVKTDAYGWIPQLANLSGFNIFYEPTRVLIDSPIIKRKEYRIGRDAVVIKLRPNFTGMWELINTYADKLALCDECAVSNLFASRLAYLFFADNTRQAETFKAAVDKVTCGDIAVAMDKSMKNIEDKSIETFLNNLSANFIAPDIQALHRSILNAFCTDIGIKNANTQKKERMISAEVEANYEETDINSRVILDSVREGIKEFHRLAPDIPLAIRDPYSESEVI